MVLQKTLHDQKIVFKVGKPFASRFLARVTAEFFKD